MIHFSDHAIHETFPRSPAASEAHHGAGRPRFLSPEVPPVSAQLHRMNPLWRRPPSSSATTLAASLRRRSCHPTKNSLWRVFLVHRRRHARSLRFPIANRPLGPSPPDRPTRSVRRHLVHRLRPHEVRCHLARPADMALSSHARPAFPNPTPTYVQSAPQRNIVSEVRDSLCSSTDPSLAPVIACSNIAALCSPHADQRQISIRFSLGLPPPSSAAPHEVLPSPFGSLLGSHRRRATRAFHLLANTLPRLRN